eukprot:gene17059-20322_t
MLFRVPQFPIDASLADHWAALKESIKISSPEFYSIIEKFSTADLERQPQRIQDTIAKYFNRAKFRATPYGSFAGVGMGYLHHQAGQKGIIIKSEQQLFGFVDWENIDQVSISPEDIISQDLYLISNSSFYPVKKAFRYISHFEDGFQLSDIVLDQVSVEILQLCLVPIRYSDLVSKMDQNTITVEDLKEVIVQLIDLQLLFTSRHPNIIGLDYFSRIGFQQQPGKQSYVIAKRKTVSSALDTDLFRQLPALAHHLHQLMPQQKNTSLQRFIELFNHKFGMAEISLLNCLDPETGVGYDDLEHIAGSADLIGRFAAGNMEKQSSDNRTRLEKGIWSQLQQGRTGTQKVINLENIKTSDQENTLPLPNTLSVLLSVTDEGIVIESLGGCTANSLLGRFSLGNQEITDYCQEIAAIEQQANSEVLFFDVAYTAESGIDNVNRRAAIYPYQLSLLNYDISVEPLCLNDIYVSIRGNEVVLRSRKLNRRLVPRIASAYNYNRSDLSVFRLLCDLQHQGIQSNLQFNLQELLPYSYYYPRVQYKQFILSPAKWKIDNKEVQARNTIAQLANYLQELGIGRFFKTGISDQTLFLDTQNESDLSLFLRLIQNKDSIYIEEAFLPTGGIINDEQGHTYQNQLLLCLSHDQEIYRGYEVKEPASSEPVRKIIPPGEDWVYFEIYCHAYRSDEILAEQITAYLEQQRPLIKKWFFIRYNENGNHIRLRLLLHDPTKGMQLISALTTLLKEDLESGIISDVQLKTYNRETERYSFAGMEAVETHFSRDSEYVFYLLKGSWTTMEQYRLCISVFQAIVKSGVITYEVFEKNTLAVSESFNDEHGLLPTDYRNLNVAYKQYKLSAMPLLPIRVQKAYEKFKNSFMDTLQKAESNGRPALLTDLMHMHVNRLFNDRQRSHEMIIYYFLVKELKRESKNDNNIAQFK